MIITFSFSTCYATAAGINTCLPTVGQVTTAVAGGKKKREASQIDETRPGNTPVVTLDGQPIDFNDIISPSRVYRREVFIDFRPMFIIIHFLLLSTLLRHLFLFDIS